MPSPVVHFEIAGRQPKRLIAFYRRLFGWKIDSNNPIGYGLVKKSRGGIGGGVMKNAKSYVTVYAAVASPRKALEAAKRLGGKVMVPVTDVPGMVRFAMFADPAGNMVGVVATKTPPAPKAKPKAKAKAKRRR
jgi:predicted enzyme related to lactoylglutathione lyase